MVNYIKVTAENLDSAKDACTAVDQRAELQIGDETWGILYDGNQRGQMSRYNESGRGAVCFGDGSHWGDWQTTGDLTLLVIDGGDSAVDEEGNEMTIEEMQDAFRLIQSESN